MARYIVTGADGYIGTGVVSCLLNNGAEVLALGLRDCGIKHNNIEVIAGDIFSEDTVIDFQGASLLHLAWRDGFNHQAMSHLEDLSLHYSFIKRAIEGGVNSIAIMGSMHEVGYYEGAIDELTPCNSSTPYGVAKNALRHLAQGLCEDADVTFQWLRGFYLVSNDGRGNSIFSKIYNAASQGQSAFPFTSGKNKYDFLQYEVFCQRVVAAIAQTEIDGIINICSGTPISLGERIEQFIEDNQLDISLAYGMYPDRPYDSPAIWGDSSKIEAILETSSVK